MIAMLAIKPLPVFRTTFLLLFFLAVVSSCKKEKENQPVPSVNSVTIGGKDYSTLKIGRQRWTVVNYDGAGGIPYRTAGEKPEYGRYYTLQEAKAIALPDGWRLPTAQDYITLAESQGVVVTNFQARGQEAIKKLVSQTNWRTIAGTNTSGFNAHPAGYSFQDSPPMDGDICEFWTADGKTISIQESATGKAHNLLFYSDGNTPGYRFNLRFVRDE